MLARLKSWLPTSSQPIACAIACPVSSMEAIGPTMVAGSMVEDAIARRIEMTVWRNGALVDVFVTPRELADR
jgi:hypothetical protein